MVRRILVRDPAQRITLAQVQQHPWYTAHLPAAEPATQQRPAQTDEEIMKLTSMAQMMSGGARAVGLSGKRGVCVRRLVNRVAVCMGEQRQSSTRHGCPMPPPPARRAAGEPGYWNEEDCLTFEGQDTSIRE
jgi:hypothetical protein